MQSSALNWFCTERVTRTDSKLANYSQRTTKLSLLGLLLKAMY